MSKKIKDPIRKKYRKLLEELRMAEYVVPSYTSGASNKLDRDEMSIKWIRRQIEEYEEEYPELVI